MSNPVVKCVDAESGETFERMTSHYVDLNKDLPSVPYPILSPGEEVLTYTEEEQTWMILRPKNRS